MDYRQLVKVWITSLFLLSWNSITAKTEVFSDWLQGDVNKAFELSQSSNKPILLYWGAVWCPPCNDLKERVFSTRRFQEMLDLVIPVYLDGDSENAQTWGDRFNASGYPTVLLLDKDGKELFRIVESLDSKEFEDAVRSSLATTKSHYELLESVSEKTTTLREWKKLAYARWETRGLPPQKTLEIIDGLASACIAAKNQPLNIQRRLAANLVDLYLKYESKKGLEAVKRHNSLIKKKIMQLTQPDGSASYASRDFILYSITDVMEWGKKNVDRKNLEKLFKNWESTAGLIKQDSSASTETKLWAIWPQIHIEAWRLNPKGKADLRAISKKTKEKVKRRVAWADKNSTTLQQRQAVISGGAYLLRKIGAHQLAIEVLLRESTKSTSPWYYYSGLSSVYREIGQYEASLAWSIRATQAAKGRATKIQWLTSEILLRLSPKLNPAHRNKLPAKMEKLYGLVFGYEDGFAGRNSTRLKRIADKLSEEPKLSAEMLKVLKKNQKKCQSLKDDNQGLCSKHFSFLSSTKQNLKG